MANTIYQRAIYEMIDFKDDVYAKYKNLIQSSNNDMTFSENADGSIACHIKYKGYEISLRITENEVFEYATKRRKNPSDAIEEIVKEKLFDELMKEKE